ncbi:hypothetical protein FTUN_8702 [Frigoriglobus tundricola]|uniref:Uncharacterized protein n=1 Tax=Frigoriglobus tundricola TaxID=2774151 RepID=A0A6M5Z787_9BACT|nr:hypothetical protein FTUN_8702 [Frigoriglobus tundricola]
MVDLNHPHPVQTQPGLSAGFFISLEYLALVKRDPEYNLYYDSVLNHINVKLVL